MAEARSAVAEPHVTELEEGKDTKQDFIRAWRKAFFRRFFKTRNQIRNGMWPTSLYNLCITTLLFGIFLVGDWAWAEPINRRLWYLARLLYLHEGIYYPIRVLIVSFSGGIVFFILLMYKRRWLLRVLLSYRGWMYEPHGKTSWKTGVWGVVVRLVSGYHPTMWSYQKSLPFLPVPPLQETLDKFITSIEPLYGKGSEELEKFKAQSAEFGKTLGPKLQRILVLKSWWAQNWVTDWWEKYIYLMGRTPISINSNYYILDHGYWQPTTRQVSRASMAIYQYMIRKREIDRETLSPLLLRKTIPLCMSQYERVFSTTRIPGEEVDQLVKYDSAKSKHVIIQRRGLYYKLDVYDTEGKPLSPQSLEKQLDWILRDADKHEGEVDETAKSLAALTGTDRTTWARARSEFFSGGVNKDSLDLLESALFHVVLETRTFKTHEERGKFLLHGDGKAIWFDKSFNLVVFCDGKSGINAEHSWGDAPVVGHIGEYFLTDEVLYTEELYQENGMCVPVDIAQSPMRTPERLIWESTKELAIKVDQARLSNQECNDDLELKIIDHQAYGKGFIKTCKVSPDAYVQCALQLAYFKDAGKFALTYEASMTRLYLHGRTETVRALTNETADFVRAMTDKSCSKAEKIGLLRKACDIHQTLYRDAMAGKGLDRHMFGLYVACKGLGYESEFLKNALMIPWTLSTSQQPQQQIESSPNCSNPKYQSKRKYLNVHLPEFQDKVCPGGGFGPVSDQGYGVSYMLPGDLRLFFHVSAKRSCALTDAARFVKHLEDSLIEMRDLFTPEKLGKLES